MPITLSLDGAVKRSDDAATKDSIVFATEDSVVGDGCDRVVITASGSYTVPITGDIDDVVFLFINSNRQLTILINGTETVTAKCFCVTGSDNFTSLQITNTDITNTATVDIIMGGKKDP